MSSPAKRSAESELESISSKVAKTEDASEAVNKKVMLEPYLYFDGNCKEAVDFYKEVLDATVTMMSTYGSSPMEVSEDMKEKIMHASIKFGDNCNIMFSDYNENMTKTKFIAGNNVHMSIYLDDLPKMREVFAKLAEGGQILMPLANSFWGSTFGTLIDKFGIHWMFSSRSDESKDAKEGKEEK